MDNVNELELLQELGKTVGEPTLKKDIRMSCKGVNVFL